jgi:hypothetical protein
MTAAAQILTFMFLLFSASHSAQARWETVEEADAEIIESTEEIEIKKDGSQTSLKKVSIRILKRSGIDKFATNEFNYNGSKSNLKVRQAYVVNGKKKIAVEKKYIEDKPTSSSITGFSSLRQVIIAFPNVGVGSVIHYQIERKTFKNSLQGHFLKTEFFGYDLDRKGQSLVVRSALPLAWAISGPDGYLNVERTFLSGREQLTFTLLKDAFFSLTEERSKFNSWSDIIMRPTLQISNKTSWQSLAAQMTPRLDALLNADVPASLMSVIEKTKKSDGFVTRANEIHSHISENFRYMGDWRSSENGHFPRSLNEIINTQFGDCKDFSLLMAVMLRKLGYKAELAAVERGSRPSLRLQLPSAHHFDHMIVRAEDEKGKVYWLDPTNTMANSGGKWADISGRPAFVLNQKAVELENIPSIHPSEFVFDFEYQYAEISEHQQRTKVKVTYSENMAAQVLPELRDKTPNELREFVEYVVSAGRNVVSGSVSTPDVSGSVARILSFSSDLTVQDKLQWTSSGYAIGISAMLPDIERIQTERRVMGIEMSPPHTDITRVQMRAGSFVGSPPPNCDIESPWIRASRTHTIDAEFLTTESRVEQFAQYISNAELKSEAFKKLQNDIRNCLDSQWMIIKKSTFKRNHLPMFRYA